MKSYRVIILFLLIAICTFPIDAKKKKYPNGDVYEGEWKNNMPEGNGTMTYVNGDIYSGSWHLGKKNGTGIYTYSEGDRYEGSWLDDIRNGQGLLTYKNGEAELLAIWDHGEIRDGTITYQGKKYYGATGETCGTKSITGPDYTFIGTWRDFMPYSGTETVTYRKYPNSVTTSTEYSNGSITKVSAKYGIYNIEGEKFEEGFPAGNAVLTYSDYIINGVFFPTDDGVEFTIDDIVFKPKKSGSAVFAGSLKDRVRTNRLKLSHDGSRWDLNGNVEISYSNGTKYDGRLTPDALRQIEVLYQDSVRLAQEKIEADAIANLQTKTFQYETFSLGNQVFDNGSYQYYVLDGKPILHGKVNASLKNITVSGSYNKGLMDGVWTFAQKLSTAKEDYGFSDGPEGTTTCVYEIPFKNGVQIGVAKIYYKSVKKYRADPLDIEIFADVFMKDLVSEQCLYIRRNEYSVHYRKKVNTYEEFKSTVNEHGDLHGVVSLRQLEFERYSDILEIYNNGNLVCQIDDGEHIPNPQKTAITIWNHNLMTPNITGKVKKSELLSRPERVLSKDLCDVINNIASDIIPGSVGNDYGEFQLNSSDAPEFDTANEVRLAKQRCQLGDQQKLRNQNAQSLPVKRVKCRLCNGTGRMPFNGKTCWDCGGAGYTTELQ